MRNKLLIAVLLVGGFGMLAIWPGLAASVVTGAEQTTFYSRTQVRQAIGSDGMPAEIYGSPATGVGAAEIAARLKLPASFARREVHAITAADRERYPNRMVILFHAGLPTANDACIRPENLGAKESSEGLNAFAVLCFKDEPYSEASVRHRRARGLDTAFNESMTDLFLALMPPVGSESRDRGGSRLFH